MMEIEQQVKRKLHNGDAGSPSNIEDDKNVSNDDRRSLSRSEVNYNGFWTHLLVQLTTSESTDIIHECDGVDLRELETNTDDYLALAEDRLRVFPFKDVKPCWHRLYTDASIIKAVKMIQQSLPANERTEIRWLDEVISVLDMALIMAGGFGRQEMLGSIYDEIETMLQISNDTCRPSKKSRGLEQLSLEEHSIPKLKYPIRRIFDRPSLTAFEKHMKEVAEPLILAGILEHWPANYEWNSIRYWMKLTLGGRRLVPVEVGRSYVDEDWRQNIMPFSKFLNDYVVEEKDVKGYLAQYDLFHHIPKLNRDVVTPDYCFLDAPAPDPDTPVAKARMKDKAGGIKLDEGEVQRNIWFGPPWTISPLHHDPYHNILCQVVGKKYIRLYSPKHSNRLYPRAADEPAPHGEGTIDMSNTSRVDMAAIELSPNEDWSDAWPGIGEVPYQEVILEPGQALYIPIGWWHYVRSCSVGISVSFWW